MTGTELKAQNQGRDAEFRKLTKEFNQLKQENEVLLERVGEAQQQTEKEKAQATTEVGERSWFPDPLKFGEKVSLLRARNAELEEKLLEFGSTNSALKEDYENVSRERTKLEREVAHWKKMVEQRQKEHQDKGKVCGVNFEAESDAAAFGALEQKHKELLEHTSKQQQKVESIQSKLELEEKNFAESLAHVKALVSFAVWDHTARNPKESD